MKQLASYALWNYSIWETEIEKWQMPILSDEYFYKIFIPFLFSLALDFDFGGDPPPDTGITIYFTIKPENCF